MTVAVTAAHGVVIKLGDGASPEVFTTIDGVHNGPNGPGFAPQMISARHHGSNDTFMKVSTVDKTPVTFDVYYDSGDTTHAAIITASKNGTKKNFEMTLTDTGSEKYAFGAFIQASYTGQVDGFNIYSIQLNIDGAISIT
jgi:hypothetical protein